MTNNGRINPECRYGHGPLSKPTGDATVKWSLRGVFKVKDSQGQPILQDSPYVFSMDMYRCPVCGYLELFDDEL